MEIALPRTAHLPKYFCSAPPNTTRLMILHFLGMIRRFLMWQGCSWLCVGLGRGLASDSICSKNFIGSSEFGTWIGVGSENPCGSSVTGESGNFAELVIVGIRGVGSGVPRTEAGWGKVGGDETRSLSVVWGEVGAAVVASACGICLSSQKSLCWVWLTWGDWVGS